MDNMSLGIIFLDAKAIVAARYYTIRRYCMFYVSKNKLVSLGILLMGAMLTAVLATIVWGTDKSFGFGDEGIYFLAARYPEEVQQNVSAVFIFTGYLFRLVGYDPAMFRVSGLVVVILSAAIFWVGLYSFLRTQVAAVRGLNYVGPLTLLFVLLGSALYYQWAFSTPTYYTLTSIVLSLFSGCVLYGVACLVRPQKVISGIVAFVIGGLVLGFCFSVKFTTAIPLLLLAIFFVTLIEMGSICTRLKFLGALLFGVALWFLFYFSFIQPPAVAYQRFMEGWQLYQSLGDHDPIKKIWAYPHDIWVLTYSAVWFYWPCYVVLIISKLIEFIRRDARAPDFRYKFTSWLVVVLAICLSLKAGIYVDTPERLRANAVDGLIQFYVAFYYAWIFLLLSVVIFCRPWTGVPSWRHIGVAVRSPWFLFLSFLLFVPIAGAVGTSNPIYNVVSFYSAPWFGLICFLLLLLMNRLSLQPQLFLLVVLGISAFCASNIIQGSVYRPAQVGTNLFAQSEPTLLGHPVQMLKLDPEKKRVITELQAAAEANGFQRGDDIIGFNYISGLVYALGGVSPGHPAYLCCTSNAYNSYGELSLTFTSVERLRAAFVLLNVPAELDVKGVLATAGIAFPEDYTQVTKVSGMGQEFTLYKPNR